MNKQKIRIGFIGLKPDSHWAAAANLPALRSLADDFEIVGVANRSYESSKKSAEALNLPHAFENTQSLISSTEIDLVVVTVKVPYHFELVSAALNAGKHVFCEWPLGNGLEEGRKLAELASQKGVVAAIGTQMRYAPEVTYLKQLIADGYVGKVLSTTLIGAGGSWGNEATEDHYYLYDQANGATLQAIPLAHTLVGLTEVLGSIDQLSARMLTQFDQVRITDTGDLKGKNTQDQLLIHGTLKGGAALSVHYRGGITRGTNLLWEINGTEGDLQVTGENGHGQIVQLAIKGAKGEEKVLKTLTPPASVYNGWPSFSGARNVGHLYALIAEDIRTGSRKAPDFQDGVVLHELVDRIEKSSQNEKDN
jgi:predicted dehydrogenase